MTNKYWFISKMNGVYLISSRMWKNNKRDNKRYNTDNYFEHYEDAFLALQEYGTRPTTNTIPEIIP